MYICPTYQLLIIYSDFVLSPVLPSKYSSLESFKALIKEHIIKPTPSVDIAVEIQEEDVTLYPVTGCQDCKKKLESSGLLPAILSVRWNFVHTRMYNFKEEVSNIVLSIITYCYHIV